MDNTNNSTITNTDSLDALVSKHKEVLHGQTITNVDTVAAGSPAALPADTGEEMTFETPVYSEKLETVGGTLSGATDMPESVKFNNTPAPNNAYAAPMAQSPQIKTIKSSVGATSDDLPDVVKQQTMTPAPLAPQNSTPVPQVFDDPLDKMMDEALADDGVDYGDGDMQASLKAEQAQYEAARQKQVEEMKAQNQGKQVVPAPNVASKEHQAEGINFQKDKLAGCTYLLNKVIAKHRFISGQIPEEKRMEVMGNLIRIYQGMKDGDPIPLEFEQEILNNWVFPDGSNGQNPPADGGFVATPEQIESGEEKPVEVPVPNITITVPEGMQGDVIVNVDSDVVKNMSETKEVNITIREISHKDLRAATIYENSPQKGIIESLNTEVKLHPIALPLSAWRCSIKPINWFQFIKLSTPSSGNISDTELKGWSVIYDHLVNPSIGAFTKKEETVGGETKLVETAFEAFLKAVKFQDKQLLMWGVLVATSDEEEELSFYCHNPKCRQIIRKKYYPRTLIHLDTERIPDHYEKTQSVAVGPEAIEHFNSVNGKRRLYELSPNLFVEMCEPSAYEYITQKLPLMSRLYKRYVPDGDMHEMTGDEPWAHEYQYIVMNALYIKAFIIKKDDKDYRYTNWDDVEEIFTNRMNLEESARLLRLVQTVRDEVTPVSFSLENVVCESCGAKRDKLVIDDIGNSVLFQASQRLANMKINLIETA